jgi:hypothetical protein
MFCFIVENFLAKGEFDKIKARLEANEAHQKRELYPNKSSPTTRSMQFLLVLQS